MEFTDDEKEFFDYKKCLSIVTQTYLTYDILTFDKNINHNIVQIIRSLINQTSHTSKTMAIHAKANKKYIKIAPIIFANKIDSYYFEIFVLVRLVY